VCGEEPLIAEAGELVVELWQHFSEELLGTESVRLIECRIAHPVSSTTIDVSIDGRLLAARPTQSDRVAVEGDDEDGVRTVTTVVRVGVLEELFRQTFTVVGDRDF
jgi:hypothetical protein